MSIADEVLRIKNNISNAYIEAEKKGATMPSVRNSENLSSTISGIIGEAGGEYDVLQTIIGDECELHITDARTGVDRSEKYVCMAIDYDGTILKQEEHYAGDVFTLPEFPTHDRLIAQEWACAVPIINNQIEVVDNDIVAGVVYTTKSGLSEFDYVVNQQTGLTVGLNMVGTKDWGDGTVNTAYSHTYSSYGKYMVTCDGEDATSTRIAEDVPLVALNPVYDVDAYCCTAIRLGSSVRRVGDIYYIFNLDTITIPNSVTEIAGSGINDVDTIFVPNGVASIGASISADKVLVLGINVSSAKGITCSSSTPLILPQNLVELGNVTTRAETLKFSDNLQTVGAIKADRLKTLVIPNSTNSVGALTISNVDNLILGNSIQTFGGISSNLRITSLVLPDSITSMPVSAEINVELLNEIVLPISLEIVRGKFFSKIYRLKKIVYPKNITTNSIEFSDVAGDVTHDFTRSESVAPFASALFTNPLSIAIVPDALYDQWIATSGWSNYASRIFKASEVTL